MQSCRGFKTRGDHPPWYTGPLITGQWFYIAHGPQGGHDSMTTGAAHGSHFTTTGAAHGVAHGLHAVGTTRTVAIFLPQ